MVFINYINNWRSNYKNYKIKNDFISDTMKKYAKKYGTPPITFDIICQDKYLSNLFVEKLGWNTPCQLYSGNIKNLPKNLPTDYVIKNPQGLSCDNVILVKNGIDLFTKNPLEKVITNKSFRNSFVIVEELVIDKKYNKCIPLDYKCFVFNGRLEYLRITKRLNNKSKNITYHSWYDKNLKNLGKVTKSENIFKDSDKYLPTQKEFDTMTSWCKQLSMFKNIVIRVDFYISKNQVLFGEFTPHHRGGKDDYIKTFKNQLDKLVSDFKH